MESLSTHRQPDTHINNNGDLVNGEPQTVARPASSGDIERSPVMSTFLA